MANARDVKFDILANDQTAKGTKSAARNLDELGDKGSKSGEDLGSSFEGVSGILEKLGPIGAAAGTAIGIGLAGATIAAGKLKEALDASFERTKAAALAGAQGLGTDPATIARIAKISGKVYGDNFFESIQDAAKGVRDVIRNGLVPEDAGDAAVAAIAEKLSTLATIAEDDTTHLSASIAQLLRTGLVKNADEAFDVLTRGFQQGGDKAQDLLDTLNEYPTQFRKLGLDAATATGLLVQGLKAGARDSDIVADALKEFSIRAVDGSKTTADGFKRLGLDGKKMAADIAAGGTRASAALQLTLDKLRNIKDPVQRAQVAVELFGTQAEDLGDALFALDPSHAVNALGDVAGATDKATKALSDAAPWTETLKRKWESFKADVGDKLVPIFNKIGEKLNEFWQKIAPSVRDALDYLKRQWADNQEGIGKFVQFLKDLEPFAVAAAKVLIAVLAGAFGILVKAMSAIGQTWEDIKSASLKATGVFLDGIQRMLDAGAQIQRALGPAWVGPNLVKAADDFRNFASKAKAELAGIPEQKIVDVRVQVSGLSQAASAIQRVLGATYVSSGIGHRAGGGRVTGGMPYVVGENRPELFVPDTNGRVEPIVPSQQSMMPSSSGPVEVHLHLDVSGGETQLKSMVQKWLRNGLTVPAKAVV